MLTPALLVGIGAADVEVPLPELAALETAWEEAAAELWTEVVLTKEEMTVERVAEAVEMVVLVELEDWIAAA